MSLRIRRQFRQPANAPLRPASTWCSWLWDFPPAEQMRRRVAADILGEPRPRLRGFFMRLNLMAAGIWATHFFLLTMAAGSDLLPLSVKKTPTDNRFSKAVHSELAIARKTHKKINSAHEGYAVILEELDEFWEEVRKKRQLRSAYNMSKELVQIAAMAQRTAEDVLNY